MYSLLIVDDEACTRKTIKKISELSENAITDVVEAMDGIDAYYKICQNVPDIMILDMDMPRMDGAALLQRLDDDDIRIKTIVVSGHDNFAYLQKSIKYGVVDYLLKPVNRRALNVAIANAAALIKKEKQIKKQDNRNYHQNFLQDWIIENQKDFGSKTIYIICIIFGEALYSEDNKIIQKIVEASQIHLIGRKNLMYYFSHCNGSVSLQINNILNKEFAIEFTGFSYEIHTGDKRTPEIYEEIKQKARSMNLVKLDNTIHPDYIRIDTGNEILDLQKLNYYHADEIIKGLDVLLDNIISGSINTPKDISTNFLKYTEIVKMWCDIKDTNCNFIYDWIMNVEESINSYNIKIVLKRLEEIRNNIAQYIVEEDVRLSSDIKAYIEQNYAAIIALNVLEDEFNYSKEYMLREFKKDYGMGIIGYLNKVRIDKATNLLVSGLSINEASLKVGFLDSNYFSRKFKEIMGVSPRSYVKEKDSK